MAEISKQLRQAIERSGRTRYRISQESGISEAVLSRFANGHTDLSLANVETLCKSLGLRAVIESTGSKKPKQKKV